MCPGVIQRVEGIPASFYACLACTSNGPIHPLASRTHTPDLCPHRVETGAYPHVHSLKKVVDAVVCCDLAIELWGASAGLLGEHAAHPSPSPCFRAWQCTARCLRHRMKALTSSMAASTASLPPSLSISATAFRAAAPLSPPIVVAAVPSGLASAR
jgi:hypothetical protein